jgi:hypothetical protein
MVMDNYTPPVATPDPAQVRRGRIILVLIALVFFGSMAVAGALRFSGWQPQVSKVHGEMLEPSVDARALVPRLADGSEYRWNPSERTWRIVVAPPADCQQECVKLARDLDIVWQLFGNRADRVHLLWVGTPPVAARRGPALRVLQPSADVLSALPRVDDAAGVPVYIIDPNGFVIMRYAPGTDPGFIRTDVSRLLKLV